MLGGGERASIRRSEQRREGNKSCLQGRKADPAGLGRIPLLQAKSIVATGTTV